MRRTCERKPWGFQSCHWQSRHISLFQALPSRSGSKKKEKDIESQKLEVVQWFETPNQQDKTDYRITPVTLTAGEVLNIYSVFTIAPARISHNQFISHLGPRVSLDGLVEEMDDIFADDACAWEAFSPRDQTPFGQSFLLQREREGESKRKTFTWE